MKGDEHQPKNNKIHKHSEQQHIYALLSFCVFHEFGCVEKCFLDYFFMPGPSLASAGTLGDPGDPVVELFCHLGEHYAPPRGAKVSQKTDRKVPASFFGGFGIQAGAPNRSFFNFACKNGYHFACVFEAWF